MLTERQREALPLLGLPDLRFDAPLGPLTRLGLGGPADALVVAPDREALAALARWARRERLALTPMQRGTDVLVRDGGIRGLVVVLGDGFAGAAAGARGIVLGGELDAREACAHLDGAPPWLQGVQGSVADALLRAEPHAAAGVREVSLVLGRGVEQDVERGSLDPARPRLGVRDEAVLASVTLEPGDHTDAAAVPPRLPGVRLFEDPRAGSTAAELLARSDLLGVRVRGARIDEVTPNQLLADEGASARDVELLLEWAQGKVRGEWGVELTVALRIVGARARG